MKRKIRVFYGYMALHLDKGIFLKVFLIIALKAILEVWVGLGGGMHSPSALVYASVWEIVWIIPFN